MLLHFVFKNSKLGTEELAQQLSALITLPGDPGSIPNIHMVTHNHLQVQLKDLTWPSGMQVVHRRMYRQNTQMYN